MTKKQWNEHFQKNTDMNLRIFLKLGSPTPENWDEYRAAYLSFVKNVDELVNVYNTENKVK